MRAPAPPGHRVPVASPTPIDFATPAAIPAPKIQRDALLSGFTTGSPGYRHIDRKEAKLVTQDELLRGLATVAAKSGYARGTGPATLLWAVLVVGDIEPFFARGQKAVWEVSWYDAETGHWLGDQWTRYPSDKWFQFWANLPDRDPSPTDSGTVSAG